MTLLFAQGASEVKTGVSLLRNRNEALKAFQGDIGPIAADFKTAVIIC
ncbi:MAG: hypothetical protein MJA27_36045 [Pseudanabaenales cyanobacterium]|nr:hypothetical protein [Pseudanabaenales cyanobacterium]